MKEAYEALLEAVKLAAEKYEENKDDSYYSYIYKYKQKTLSKAAESLRASGDIKAELEKQRADYAECTELVEQEEIHPTFDWAGEHVWEMIYTGMADGAKEAVKILEEHIN